MKYASNVSVIKLPTRAFGKKGGEKNHFIVIVLFYLSEGTTATFCFILMVQTRGALLCSSLRAEPLFTWATKKKFNSPLRHSAQFRCVFVCVRVGYYCHRVVILSRWHGRKASGSQSQLAPQLMGRTCVCMCVNVDTGMSCVCVNAFVTDSPSPDPRLSSSCTMSRALKHWSHAMTGRSAGDNVL